MEYRQEDLENYGGNSKPHNGGAKAPQNLSSSMVRKKSDPLLVTSSRFQMMGGLMANFQQVIFGTKLAVLFPAIPLAVAADFYRFGRVRKYRKMLNRPKMDFKYFCFKNCRIFCYRSN